MTAHGRVLDIAIAAAGAAVTLLAAGALVLAAGASPGQVYGRLIRETLFSPYGIGQTLFQATPLVFTGLAVSLPLRAGLFNIGAEGQAVVGAFAAGVVGLMLAPLPGLVIISATALSAFVAGGLWGCVAGALKSRFGAHEVISTIMLNFIAVAVTGYLVTYHLAVPETIHTATIPEKAWLVRIPSLWPAARGSSANLALVAALIAATGTGWLLRSSRLGFEIRAVGFGARAAEAGGISPGRTHVAALALGGALAGLVGMHEVLGYRHYFLTNFSEGSGFMGIVVALLGGGRPLGVVLAALLFGAMSHGALVVNDLVPQEIVDVLQAVVILVILAGSFVSRRARRVARKRALSAG